MFERLNRMTQLTTSREAQVSGQGKRPAAHPCHCGFAG